MYIDIDIEFLRHFGQDETAIVPHLHDRIDSGGPSIQHFLHRPNQMAWQPRDTADLCILSHEHHRL
jgi:hypothetical protein